MAVASGPAGPVLAGPVFAVSLSRPRMRKDTLMGVAPRELLRCDHSVSCALTAAAINTYSCSDTYMYTYTYMYV
jgi:hypothetical protein